MGLFNSRRLILLLLSFGVNCIRSRNVYISFYDYGYEDEKYEYGYEYEDYSSFFDHGQYGYDDVEIDYIFMEPDMCGECHGCVVDGHCKHISDHPRASMQKCHGRIGAYTHWCTEDHEPIFPPTTKVHTLKDTPPYKPADGGARLNESICVAVAENWVESQRVLTQRRHAADGISLTFFLHVPRTAGRVLSNCVLSPLLSEGHDGQSYDVLRDNFSDAATSSYGYFASHQDHRLVDLATENGRPKVAIMVRNPLDRVLSMYEFSAEVSARTREVEKTWDPPNIATRHVWPWNHLVPFWDEALLEKGRFRRHHARLNKGRFIESKQSAGEPCKPGDNTCRNVDDGVEFGQEQLQQAVVDAFADSLDEARDPYNNSVLVPLVDFLDLEMSKDIVNNLMTFQLLGLTDHTPVLSMDVGSGPAALAEANERGDLLDEDLPLSASPRVAGQLRRCAREHGPDSRVSKILLETALMRLEDVDVLMIQDRFDDSIAVATNRIHKKLRRGKPEWSHENITECIEEKTKGMLQRRNQGSANMLWPDGTKMRHGSQSRATIREEVVHGILRDNWMDAAIHKRAQAIFEQHFQEMEADGKPRMMTLAKV